MRVVIAPDSFKGSIPADRAARAVGEGWRSVRSADEVVVAPMADGGEGTLDAVAAAVPGSRRVPVAVPGPDGRTVQAEWVLLPDGTGVVELAATSGLGLMERLDPLGASTLGFGEAIAAALDAGAARLLLAVGGSASTDGGAGMLTALGARLLDADGAEVPSGGGGLGRIVAVDLRGLRALPPGGVIVLSDVVNPLTGPSGAAAVFGEQKGADAAQRRELEDALTSWAARFPVDPGSPGAGAAGGTGFGALVWGARLASGADAVADAVGLPDLLAGADLAITGEGRYDAQTAGGKAPSVVVRLAAAAGVPVALVAGSIAADPIGFTDARSLVDLAGGVESALADPERWLRAAGTALAHGVAR